MVLNTLSVGAAVTPAILACAITHYSNRRSLHQKPTVHLSYHEGLSLVRRFILYASHHTVEEIQAFTSQWVPAPRWVRLKELDLSDEFLKQAARHIQSQLGPEGIKAVGGREWWQWRPGNAHLKAEWIEMRSDYNEHKKNKTKCTRVMLYVHGGAYYFGSVDEHRYQLQRHARKLKARCLAPRYRLAPQFPFPCGLQDCLAAYLYLLSEYDPSNVLLAGDSAGGGMVLAMLLTIRDQGIPLPAGALLLSPWVDLTHSFPSLSADGTFDYIPAYGFHHRPSRSWPAPQVMRTRNDEEQTQQGSTPKAQTASFFPDLSITIDGKLVEIRDQIQMYAPNHLLAHPLVSPALAPTLGGLPPLLIQTGGGELLRDEQIYLAHKAADPDAYLPPEQMLQATDPDGLLRAKYPPTDVQLQVWDDLCHVAHTLSWTRPAKYMYRAVAQFGAWTLARAQQRSIDILDDDDISEISSESSDDESTEDTKEENGHGNTESHVGNGKPRRYNGPSLPLFSSVSRSSAVGRAGDPIPPFAQHMIRQRVDRNGNIYALAPAEELPGCQIARDDVGKIKEGPVRKWLDARQRWDKAYASKARAIQKQREDETRIGYIKFKDESEQPPAAALAGRRRLGRNGKEVLEQKSRKKSLGMSLWSLWGSKHDEKTIEREQRASTFVEEPTMPNGARKNSTQSRGRTRRRSSAPKPSLSTTPQSPYAQVRDEGQAGPSGPSTPTAENHSPNERLQAPAIDAVVSAGFNNTDKLAATEAAER